MKLIVTLFSKQATWVGGSVDRSVGLLVEWDGMGWDGMEWDELSWDEIADEIMISESRLEINRIEKVGGASWYLRRWNYIILKFEEPTSHYPINFSIL